MTLIEFINSQDDLTLERWYRSGLLHPQALLIRDAYNLNANLRHIGRYAHVKETAHELRVCRSYIQQLLVKARQEV